MKQILFYNSKNKSLTLKETHDEAEMSMLLLGDLLKDQSIAMKMLSMTRQETVDYVEKNYRSKQHTIKLMDSDEFDLELGFALLYLEMKLGSKRKRELFIEKKGKNLLTKDNYRSFVIMLVIEMMDVADYDEYSKFVHSIYANESKEKKLEKKKLKKSKK